MVASLHGLPHDDLVCAKDSRQPQQLASGVPVSVNEGEVHVVIGRIRFQLVAQGFRAFGPPDVDPGVVHRGAANEEEPCSRDPMTN